MSLATLSLPNERSILGRRIADLELRAMKNGLTIMVSPIGEFPADDPDQVGVFLVCGEPERFAEDHSETDLLLAAKGWAKV